MKRFYNSIMGSGVRVIAISDFVAGYVRTAFKTPDDRIRMIHRCVDLMRFHPDLVTPDRLIRMSDRWRAPDGATIILLPGRLTRWKGHRVLIEAIAELKNPDVFVILQGSDQGRHKYRNELLALIKKLHLEGQIRIVDHDNDVPAMYRAAHIIVSASTDPEGFGRVAIEGMAMGRLVIATNHGGSKETIIDGQTGWLVPPNDPGALARVLTDILALSDVERSVIGDRAIDHVAQHFSREKFMNETLRVYNEILSIRVESATN
jgi:glycosyltransferase involved in cell wall biosynthesis